MDFLKPFLISLTLAGLVFGSVFLIAHLITPHTAKEHQAGCERAAIEAAECDDKEAKKAGALLRRQVIIGAGASRVMTR